MSGLTARTDNAGSGLDELPTVVSRAPSETLGEPEDAVRGTGTDDVRPALLLTRGPGAGRRLPLAGDAVTVLGRHADCDLVLSDVTVSRRHAEIRAEGEHFVLTDIGSLNGTYVNQHPVDTVALADGDAIAIGIFRFRFAAPVAAEVASSQLAETSLA